MSSYIVENITGSITVFVQSIIEQINTEHPDINAEFVDWETQANIEEFPDNNLLGPTAITVEDFGQQQVSITFAVAASSYTNDIGMFKLRSMLGIAFERMRPQNKFIYYDSFEIQEKSIFIITPGTILSPMTRPETRPWQYVQCQALLVPTSEDA